MDQLTLRADPRTESGSRPARRMRREGRIPAVVYGRDVETTPVSVNARDLYAALHTEAGLNALINLQVNGDELLTVAREVQRHPVRGDVIHLDFVNISLTETIEAEVVLDVEGTPLGVSEDGGIMELVRNSVVIEALPTNIPSGIAVDVSELHIGDSLKVSDLPEIEGVTYTEDPESTIVTVLAPRVEVEPEEELTEEELAALEAAEGEEGAEPGDEDESGEGDDG